MTVTVYGIQNCDTMKKARGWLAEQGVEAAFHDYRKHGIDAATLGGWADKVGWDKLLNRSGTTFRKIDDAAKADLDRDKAIALMVANPSAIRRPVLVAGDDVLVGLDPSEYTAMFER